MNNLSPLPFYTDEGQISVAQSYAYGEMYHLFCPVDMLPPFQIKRGQRSQPDVLTVKLLNLATGDASDISDRMGQTGLEAVSRYNANYIVYPARLPLLLGLLPGVYQITISDGIEKWYSEPFTMRDDTDSLLELSWWDDADLVSDGGQIIYTAPLYRNRLFLPAEIGMPEYKYEEEGETRDGYFFPLLQISEKVYKFTFAAPEYICDAIRVARLADHVQIRDKSGRVYECDTFLATPKWLQQGYLAAVEVEFETDTVIKKTGRARITRDKGDFNSDYNNDYFTKKATT